jgi:hypothetical protein
VTVPARLNGVIEVRTIQRKPIKPEYATWLAIKKRGPVCRRWRCYANFRRDVGPKPSWRHLVIRDDASFPFEPSNARWRIAKPYRSPRATARAG